MLIPPAQFNDHQVARLQRLGLKDEQISELRKRLLSIRTILSIHATREPVTNVRDELTRLRDALLAGCEAIQRMQNPSQMPALREAQARLMLTEYARQVSPGSFDRTNGALAQMLAVVEAAISELPKKPTRSRKAHPMPVGIVADALAVGWATAFCGENVPVLPDKLRPSSGAKSFFREVVGICYEAATGRADLDPERAIKSYLAIRRREREEARKRPTVQVVVN
jgi:hypothetical protein